MKLVALSLLSLVACSKSPPSDTTTPPPSGSGSGSPVAVVDAAPPDAPKMCTEMACEDQFGVVYSKPLTAAGKYSFDVEVDGKKRHCDAQLPQKPCKADGTMNDVFTCKGDDVKVELGYQGGCTMKPAEQNLGERLSIQGNPAKVKVTITLDKKQIASKEFTGPAYKEFSPNGPGCGPVCKQASDKLEIK